MVHIIFVNAGCLQFLRGQAFRELMYDGGDDLQVGQLLGPDIGQQPCHFPVRHDIALGNIAHGCRKLSVGTAQLRDDDLGHGRILL